VVVRTATSAPPRVLPVGVHRLDGSAGLVAVASVELPSVPVTALTTAPPTAATNPVLEQGERVSGRSPLALWFTRPVAADAVDVALRLVDPLGREVVQTLTVPGWVAPPPDVHVSILDVMAIAGRGAWVAISTDADTRRRPPYVMEIVAQQRLRLPVVGALPPAGLPGRPGPEPFQPGPGPVQPGRVPFAPGPGPVFPPPRLRSLSGSFPMDEIPWNEGGFVRSAEIQVVRNRVRRRGQTSPPPYEAFIPLTGPLRITVSIVAPDGTRVTAVAGD
jgi:hypothetical protein